MAAQRARLGVYVAAAGCWHSGHLARGHTGPLADSVTPGRGQVHSRRQIVEIDQHGKVGGNADPRPRRVSTCNRGRARRARVEPIRFGAQSFGGAKRTVAIEGYEMLKGWTVWAADTGWSLLRNTQDWPAAVPQVEEGCTAIAAHGFRSAALGSTLGSRPAAAKRHVEILEFCSRFLKKASSHGTVRSPTKGDPDRSGQVTRYWRQGIVTTLSRRDRVPERTAGEVLKLRPEDRKMKARAATSRRDRRDGPDA